MTHKAVFITGAAAGIGAACAEYFHARGWFVGLYDVNAQACRAAAEGFGAENARAGALDVTDPRAWETALADFWQAAGQRLDVLVNNAGILASGPFRSIDLARQHAIVDVNFKGLMNGCHAAHAYLARTPGARVVNMASASAIHGQPDLATYSATKFAVRGLTEALDIEWQGDDIRVMAVWPLFVRTGMIDALDGAESVNRLGVKLSAQDVARAVHRAATGGRWRRHWPVGGMARLTYHASRFAPGWANRWLVKRISGR